MTSRHGTGHIQKVYEAEIDTALERHKGARTQPYCKPTQMRSQRLRLLLALLALPVLFLLFLYLGSYTAFSDLLATTGAAQLPDEIFGLIHFVTSPDEADRIIFAPTHNSAADVAEQLGGTIVPEKPVEVTWYAVGSITKATEHTRRKGPANPAGGWEDRLRVLRDEYPLVVFSKVRTPT